MMGASMNVYRLTGGSLDAGVGCEKPGWKSGTLSESARSFYSISTLD
jgi:hypothetical protein